MYGILMLLRYMYSIIGCTVVDAVVYTASTPLVHMNCFIKTHFDANVLQKLDPPTTFRRCRFCVASIDNRLAIPGWLCLPYLPARPVTVSENGSNRGEVASTLSRCGRVSVASWILVWRLPCLTFARRWFQRGTLTWIWRSLLRQNCCCFCCCYCRFCCFYALRHSCQVRI